MQNYYHIICKCLLIILGLEFSNLGILLSLNISLPLLNSLLSLALEALVRGEALLLARRGILADLLVNTLIQLLKTIRLNLILDV